MSKLNAARQRTDAKLRFAGVHLTELKVTRRDDYDFDMAHHESFLFHLLGVRDSLLQEMNLLHSCGLATDQVRKADLKAKLAKLGITSPALEALDTLEADDTSWISIAGRMRHWSTHRRDVPRTYERGKADDVSVHLHDTLMGREIEVDSVDLFAQWLVSMKQLVEDLRAKMPGVENG